MTPGDIQGSPLTPPHAVVPHGQMRGDPGHGVTPAGQGADENDLAPPNVEQLQKMFDESRDLTDRARTEQQLDQDYYDGPAQLKSEVRDILKARGQPPIFDNRIAPGIDGILGVLEGAKVDPRGFPRNPDDQGAADVCTKTLRYSAERANWQSIRMDCAEDYLKQGITAAIVEWGGEYPTIQQIRWETFFYDAKSRKADFSDAKYLGIAKWMYADEVKTHPEWAERAKLLGDICTVREQSAFDETWEDRPTDAYRWVDKRRNRVLVVEIYYSTPRGWLRCVFCAAGWLEYGFSPYKNPKTGEPRCPIEAQSFKVDRENNRYGPIRNMRPMQDEVNARRSRGLHLLNSRKVQNVELNAPTVDPDTVRGEAARADGVLPYGWQEIPATDMASGNLQMLTEAKDSLSRMVPVAVSQDLREGTASSGRARQVAQQAGLTQFGRGFGRFNDFEERVYRQLWVCCQQFMTDEQYIRITDNPRAPEFLKINEPVMGMVMQPQPVTDPMTGEPVVDPMTGQPAVQQVPSIGMVDVKNRIAEMDMDIIIAATPDTVALEQEVFDSLMGLVQSGVDPFSPQFELLLQLAPLPDKTGVMEKIEALKSKLEEQQAQQAQAQQQMQEQAMQIEMQKQGTEIAKNMAAAEKTQADTQRTQVQTEGDQIANLQRMAELYVGGVEQQAPNGY